MTPIEKLVEDLAREAFNHGYVEHEDAPKRQERADVRVRIAKSALLAAFAQVEKERDELQAGFDLRWKADMRAITRWREEKPEPRELVCPDHVDLVIWLADEREKLQKERDEARTALQEMTYRRDVMSDVGLESERTVAKLQRENAALRERVKRFDNYISNANLIFGMESHEGERAAKALTVDLSEERNTGEAG